MQFNKHTAIYLQIANYMYDCILDEEWNNGARIPSIRDMAMQLEVNPNTVTRAYTLLQEDEIVENQRGIGYFTALDAREKVLKRKQKAFLENELPNLFNSMQQLGLTLQDLQRQYEKFIKETIES